MIVPELRDNGVVIAGTLLREREVRSLYTDLALWLMDRPAPEKDLTIGSPGGDPQLTKAARASRAAKEARRAARAA